MIISKGTHAWILILLQSHGYDILNNYLHKLHINISGEITEVDEDSAYSWEACVNCNSDQLQEDSSQGYIYIIYISLYIIFHVCLVKVLQE